MGFGSGNNGDKKKKVTKEETSKKKKLALRYKLTAEDREELTKKKKGRKLKYKSPAEFLEKVYEYFNSRDKNPRYKKDVIRSGDNAGMIINIPLEQPYTIEGMCVFLKIDRSTFSGLYCQRKEFIPVTTHAREVIEADQLEGAIMGIYNPNIIARKLGLADKKEISADNTITWIETSTYGTEQETDNSEG
jgi:hypothetical protein